jgi:Sulfotransferase domain
MLKVIGAGFSRTGTFSLKRALEILGFGPCYHMDELFRRPEHVRIWANATDDELDFGALFETYASALDAPVCHFWRQIRDAHPKAKVILTIRDAESWYASFEATVYQTMRHYRRALDRRSRLLVESCWTESSRAGSKTRHTPCRSTRLTSDQS